MALKRAYATADEIPDELKALYVEKDGKHVLDLDGDNGAHGALEKERKSRALAEKALNDLKRQLGDLDPVKAREALKTIAELEEKNLLGEGNFEEAVAKRVERIAADSKTREETLAGQVKALNTQLEELLIDGALRTEAIKHGVQPTAVDDVVLYGRTVFRLKDGKPVPMKGEEILYGKEANKPQTPEEWIADRAKDRPHWFQPSNGGGTPPAGGSRQNGKNVELTRDQAKDPQQYRAAKEQAAKAGGQVVIAAQ